MVQVDVFWAYAFGGSLGVASGIQLAKEAKPLYTEYFVKSLLFLALVWAPTGLLLLIKHPSWETMQVANNFQDIPPWIVLAFGFTNVTQGILGFIVSQRLMAKGKYYLASINALSGYFGMFFILLYGWDGLGYDRFLYDRDTLVGSPAWTPGASGTSFNITEFITSVTNFLQSGVFVTLMIDAVILFPPFVISLIFIKQAYKGLGIKNEPSNISLIIYYAAVILIGTLASAAISALTVNFVGSILGVGNHIARAKGEIPSNTLQHVLSYFIGLPLSLIGMYYLLWKKGMPFYYLLKPFLFNKA